MKGSSGFLLLKRNCRKWKEPKSLEREMDCFYSISS